MSKYRIRLSGGRVIGPFDKDQIFELKMKGHIKGDEEFQDYPVGNWSSIKKINFYTELFNEKKNQSTKSSDEDPQTFLIDIKSLKQQMAEEEIKDINLDELPHAQELTETIRIENTNRPIPVSSEKSSINSTKQTHPSLNPELKKLISSPVEEILPEVKKINEIIPKPDHDATQVLNLKDMDLFQIKKESQDFLESIKVDEKKSSEASGPVDAPKSKSKWIIYAGAFALVYALLFPQEEIKPKFIHLEPKIIFPIPFDVSDEGNSRVEYKKGLEEYSKGNYPSLIKAAEHFKKAYENDVEDLKSLSLLIRTYGEQLKYSSFKLKDANTIFNIVQSKKSFLIQNPNGVVGLNLFYASIGKHAAAADVVEKYLTLKPKEIIQDLFAVNVKTLIKLGKMDEAKPFYTALTKAPQKSALAYEAIFEFLTINDDEEFPRVLETAIKEHPENVEFLLKSAELSLKENDQKDLLEKLQQVENLAFDSNNLTRSKYLEIKGLYLASLGKTKEATDYLEASLKLDDRNDLRLKLSTLSASEDSSIAVNNLINDSKSIRFLIEAQKFYEQKNYELALSAAAKAADASPSHVPSQLMLAQTQHKLGLARQSITTLEKLSKTFPENKQVSTALINSYIQTFKFKEAKNTLQIHSSTDLKDTWEYASLYGKLNNRMGDSLQAMSWYKNSISMNPLNDEDVFALALILLKKSNFVAAKSLLNKCIELDPVNPDYRIAYARMLYETLDDQAAIGYLLSLQKEFGENSKIISEIAIFYYRSGKAKDFEDYKKKLESLPNKDKALYEFLIKAALLDEKFDVIPEYVENLIEIEPADFDQMMTAGKVLFESGKLVDAAKWFKRIQDKLSSFPKVLYYSAKIDFLSGDLDGAYKKLDEDLKENGENDDDLVFKAQIHLEKGKKASDGGRADFIAAENLFKMAQKINPRSFDAIMGLAEVSMTRSNHDLALDLFKRALKLRPEEPEVHRKMGDLYRLVGQGALAIESYKMYLEMDPESTHKNNLEKFINDMK